MQKTASRQRSLSISNQNGEYYALVPFHGPRHTLAFITLHKTGLVLNSLPVPRDNVEWLNSVRAASERAKLDEIPTPDYHWPWLIRTYLIVEMRHQGIKRLEVKRDWCQDELTEALQPDRSKWISLWMSSLAGGSLKKLLRKLDFVEPLEMLSCYACLLGDNAIESIDADKLNHCVSAIARRRRQMGEEACWECNPALVMKDVMDKNV